MNSLEPDTSEGRDCGVTTAVQGTTRFALDLYARLRTDKGNLFFSPYSIAAALAMTYAGARGHTASQMAQALCFLLDQAELHPAFASLAARLDEVGRQGQVQLKVANSLWPDQSCTLLDCFIALTRQYYGAQTTKVDYGDPPAAAGTINAWVEAQTENRIRDLLSPDMVTGALLVLVNAIYFKGNWASGFDPQHTRKAAFQVAPAEQIQVEMMTQTRGLRYGEDHQVQILELPYAGGAVSMLVLLPDQHDGLARLEASLTAESLGKWMAQVQHQPVAVYLPRFGTTWSFQLRDTLRAMGMRDAFSVNADFSGIAAGPLMLADVVHKAVVTVNEEGSEAAAATAVITRGGSTSPVVFRADRPFLFLIRDNGTDSILFLGRVTNPAPQTHE